MDNPRTVAAIVSDLLQFAVDGQWSGELREGCHCHPEYVSCCPECSEMKSNEHKSDCKRMLIIKETRAFLEAENKLSEELGEDTVYIP